MTTTSSELFETLETFVQKIFSLASADAADLLVESDLSFSQARTLFVLGHADGPTPINEIAKRLGLSVATAGRNIDHMVKVGILDRHESPDDRRVKLVSLSKRGWEIVDQQFEQKRRAVRAFTERVPEDQAVALTEALRPILAGESLRICMKEAHD
ncbi:hypothetical protein ASD11_01720 [Aeromicrobium sp. Root495]|uniref:MarR family winged helix-turn-helix transcriptional regulator n=1 Tax=Aeromicrobium sp. Root495 TaxID=1736550 RepID=UPI0006F6D57B|nr:MarR family transcriptional regulator [Aeromicrobium sp. Root495]KQY58408.1 hypothetical protein ASD11_01720 [Aeromicrobium sp. Root495]